MNKKDKLILTEEKALGGDPDAQFEIAMAYYTGEGKSGDYHQACNWLKKATKQDHALSQAWLGSCYHNGFGAQVDLSKAKKLYEASIEQGEALGSYLLALLYFEQQDGGKDFRLNEIIELTSTAASQGVPEAQAFFAWAYHSGYGVSADFEKAFYWWNKAAHQGVAEAMYSLAGMYMNGEGVEKDYLRAYFWFYLAQHYGDEKAAEEIIFFDSMLSNEQKIEIETNALKSIDNEDNSIVPHY